MTLDPNRLRLIADDLESLAENCRALEGDAERGAGLMNSCREEPFAADASPEALADIGQRVQSGALLSDRNLLIWRNIGRRRRAL